MVSMVIFFYLFVILFAVIGAMRGWAQEVLVTFSMILAIFIITVVENHVPFLEDFFEAESVAQFWLRTIIVLVLVFSGYQTPRISRFASTVKKEKISDTLLGLFLGIINGYLIVGSIWSFMDFANYPFEHFIAPENVAEEYQSMAESAMAIIERLPPIWLGKEPWIFIAVGLAFFFVLVVFI